MRAAVGLPAAMWKPSANMRRTLFNLFVPSRREFLRFAGLAGLSAAAGFPSLGGSALRAAPPVFEEIPSSVSGITWVHENAMSPEPLPARDDGPGRGVSRLTTTTAGWTSSWSTAAPADFYTPKAPLKNALYKNNRDGTFTDVTDKAGVAGGKAFGMGCAVGDYDNDGYPDILVTAYGQCTLYKNNGNGTFTDVTDEAGARRRPDWTTSAVWFDYDNDGKLDLFLCSFVRVLAEEQRLLRRQQAREALLLHSARLQADAERCCTTTTATARLPRSATAPTSRRALGKALGVVATDINNDGLMDLVRRQRHGAELPVCEPRQGQVGRDRPRGGSGVQRERHAAFGHGRGRGRFRHATASRTCSSRTSTRRCSRSTRTTATSSSRTSPPPHGVAQATRLLSGWGLKFFDYDNDGQMDLFLANGHPDDMIENYSQQVKYKEPLLLFHNNGTKLANVSAQSGPVFAKQFPARGLAIGDYNNDGRIDVFIGNNGGAPLLLKNNAGEGNHWLGLKLQGTACNRDAIGALITWSVGRRRSRSQLKTGGGSYLSSHDPREVLGIGTATKIDCARDQMAAAERPRRAVHRAADRSLCDGGGGEGEGRDVERMQDVGCRMWNVGLCRMQNVGCRMLNACCIPHPSDIRHRHPIGIRIIRIRIASSIRHDRVSSYPCPSG